MGKPRTLHVVALPLSKPSASLLYPTRQGYLNIAGHCLIPFAHPALPFRVPDHHIDPLYRILTIMESPRDFLSQSLDIVFLPLLHVLVVKPW